MNGFAMHSIHALLETSLEQRASDLIIKAGAPPVLRIDGRITPLKLPVIAVEEARELAYEILCAACRDRMLHQATDTDDTEELLRKLDKQQEIDVVFTIPGRMRVRANLFLERGVIGAALRMIRLHPATLEELNLPASLRRFALEPHGLIIITGPTGSGKTTTMTALIEEINRNRQANIFTVEDPVEYLYEDKKSLIHQREVGHDTQSFATALRSVMRQTPDIIAIGELRDRETIEVALSASETGHLVVTTLHTPSAATTLDRLVNYFPHHLKSQICQQLSASLLCITSQRLVSHASGKGRIPAVEILINSPTVRKHLEEGHTHDLYATMRDGAHFGMNTINQALVALYENKAITFDDALRNAGNAAELRQILRKQ